jgi:membrane protein YdbS with pleckstrin-like domain
MLKLNKLKTKTMLIPIQAIIAISIILIFIIILSINIIVSIKEKEYILLVGLCILLFISCFIIFLGINHEIKYNIKHNNYEKTILYNECGIPIDTIITLKN